MCLVPERVSHESMYLINKIVCIFTYWCVICISALNLLDDEITFHVLNIFSFFLRDSHRAQLVNKIYDLDYLTSYSATISMRIDRQLLLVYFII